MSINAQDAAIRTVIVGALMGHSEASERGFDALFVMRQAEAIVKALKIATLFGQFPFLAKLFADSAYAGSIFQLCFHGPCKVHQDSARSLS
jgi:hypothetical protein